MSTAGEHRAFRIYVFVLIWGLRRLLARTIKGVPLPQPIFTRADFSGLLWVSIPQLHLGFWVFWVFSAGEMAACCSQARAVWAAETSSYAAAAAASTASSSTRWSARRYAGGVQQKMVKGGHLGTKLVVVETGLVASSSKQRTTGLVVEAANRIFTGRSYALSSTLKIEEGKEEEVTALCKSIVSWAQEKMVGLHAF